MTRREADEYLNKHGDNIIKIIGVKSLAVVKSNCPKNIEGFEIEAIVNTKTLEQSRIRPYIDISLRNTQRRVYNLEMKAKRKGLKSNLGLISDMIFKKIYEEIDENIFSSTKNSIEKYNNKLDNKTKEKIDTDIKPSDAVLKFLNSYGETNITQSGRGCTIIGGTKGGKGTLGGLLKLKNKKGTYLISNWHVLMKSKLNFDNTVHSDDYHDEKNPIAKVFWGRFDSEYDIAIAKIESDEITEDLKKKYFNPEINISQKKPIKPEIGDKVYIHGYKTQKYSYIHSNNAYVKIDDNIFKNQIITTEHISLDGDSGSLLYKYNTKEKTYDVVGLVFAGDEEHVTVANPLHDLFSHPIDCTIIQNELMKHRNELDFEFEYFV